MPKKRLRKTLPKDLDALFDAAAASGDDAPVRAALDACDPGARSGFGQHTALMSRRCTPAIARWLVERGTDINAANTWGRTALHESAFARFHYALAPDVLLTLGADVHSRSNEGLTPLHSAADGKNVGSATLLLAHGADLNARTNDGATPLEYGLLRMSNIDLAAMVPFAELMLAAGALVTPRAQAAVLKAAETFEFHRAGFARDSVDEASAASASLCALFEVTPPPRRVMHDGASPIVVAGATWQARHAELWQALVPSSGPSATVQGEVIRITGRVSGELRRNGGGNWDADYAAMVAALGVHLASHAALSAAELADLRTAQREVRQDDAASERLAELAVTWVAKNSQPIALARPAYAR
jgi:hypothetical protein